jgi:hypothetical protein
VATVKCPWLGLERAEVIVALGHMLHGVLAKQNLWAFSKASIFAKLSDQRIVTHAAKVRRRVPIDYRLIDGWLVDQSLPSPFDA